VEFGPQFVTVECPVAEESAERQPLDQLRNTATVVSLARQQHEVDEVAQGVDQSDDLGRQPAARTSDRLALSPPLAPVPF